MEKILLLLVALFLLASCTSPESKIQTQIEDANYCNSKEDCVLAGSKCPFDCYIYSNFNEVDRIKDLIDFARLFDNYLLTISCRTS